MIKRFVITCLVTMSAMSACMRAGRQAPATAPSIRPAAEPDRAASMPVPPPRPYRPLHKGGADISTGLRLGDGVERSRYNSHHYVVSETFWANGPRPITLDYNRDGTTNAVNSVTMSCVGLEGAVTRPVSLASNNDRATKLALMRETCLSPR